MGIIKAMITSVRGTLKNQWKEFIYCDSLPADCLIARASKTKLGVNHGDDNIITDGSTILVADGQVALVTDKGKVAYVFDEPGEHTFHSDASPGLFSGSKLSSVLKEIWRRFTFGGDVPHAPQRVYYVNMKMLRISSFNTMSYFNITDDKVGLSFDGTVFGEGYFGVRVADPAAVYRKVHGSDSLYALDSVIQTLSAEVASAFNRSMSSAATIGLRPYELGSYAESICSAILDEVNDSISDLGLRITHINLDSMHLDAADKEKLSLYQRGSSLDTPEKALGYLIAGINDAKLKAAANGYVNPLMIEDPNHINPLV